MWRFTDIGINETDFSGTGTPPQVCMPSWCGVDRSGQRRDLHRDLRRHAGRHGHRLLLQHGDRDRQNPSRHVDYLCCVDGKGHRDAAAWARTLVKSASPSSVTAAGQSVTYSLLVTNTGNQTVSAGGIRETNFTGRGTLPSATCPAGAASIAPGATVTCTAPYIRHAGRHQRGLGVQHRRGDGDRTDSRCGHVAGPSTAKLTAVQSPALTVAKSANPTTVTAGPAKTVTFSYLVTNTGNVTLTNATIVEGTFTGTGALSAVTCPAGAASMLPGAAVTCTATYSTTRPIWTWDRHQHGGRDGQEPGGHDDDVGRVDRAGHRGPGAVAYGCEVGEPDDRDHCEAGEVSYLVTNTAT